MNNINSPFANKQLKFYLQSRFVSVFLLCIFQKTPHFAWHLALTSVLGELPVWEAELRSVGDWQHLSSP